MVINMKKLLIAIACSQAIGCASLKYPNWEKVSIESSVINKSCESKLRLAEHCNDDDCDTWFKKRATIYNANTVVRHKNSYASYFYCAAGLPPYQNPVAEKPKPAETCSPKHDEKYQQDSHINIKGYYLGMDKCEIDESLKSSDGFFSIVGLNVYGPQIEFIENKLSSFYVRIPASYFYRLQSAIQSKYPDIKCNDSVVHNRMNASFDQTECTLIFDKGRLTISKYSSDLDKSSLSLLSNAVLEKQIREDKIKEKDI